MRHAARAASPALQAVHVSASAAAKAKPLALTAHAPGVKPLANAATRSRSRICSALSGSALTWLTCSAAGCIGNGCTAGAPASNGGCARACATSACVPERTPPRAGRACIAKVRPCEGGPAGVTDMGATSAAAAAAASRPGVRSSGAAWRAPHVSRARRRRVKTPAAQREARTAAALASSAASAARSSSACAQRSAAGARVSSTRETRTRRQRKRAAPASRGSL